MLDNYSKLILENWNTGETGVLSQFLTHKPYSEFELWEIQELYNEFVPEAVMSYTENVGFTEVISEWCDDEEPFIIDEEFLENEFNLVLNKPKNPNQKRLIRKQLLGIVDDILKKLNSLNETTTFEFKLLLKK